MFIKLKCKEGKEFIINKDIIKCIYEEGSETVIKLRPSEEQYLGFCNSNSCIETYTKIDEIFEMLNSSQGGK